MARVKGTVILDSIRAVKEREGESKCEAIIDMLDEDARRIFRKEIFPTSWYPLDALIQFLKIDLRETAGGDEGVLVARAEAVVERQLRDTYRVFIKAGSPQSVVKRMSTIHQTYFEGITVQSEMLDACRAKVTYGGLLPNYQILRYVFEGFFRKALHASGAKGITVEVEKPKAGEESRIVVLLSWAGRLVP